MNAAKNSIAKTAHRIAKKSPIGPYLLHTRTPSGLPRNAVTDGTTTLIYNPTEAAPVPGLPMYEGPSTDHEHYCPDPSSIYQYTDTPTHDHTLPKNFNDDLRWLLKAAAGNDIREALNGVYFDAQAQNLVAADGHRIHTIHAPHIFNSVQEAAILSRTSAQTLLALITEMGGKKVSIKLDINTTGLVSTPKQLTFTLSNGDLLDVILHCKAISANYPDWQRVKADPRRDHSMIYIPQNLPDLAHQYKDHAKMASTHTTAPLIRYNNGSNQMTLADDTVVYDHAKETAHLHDEPQSLPDKFGVNIQYLTDARMKAPCETYISDNLCCVESADGTRAVTIMNARV